LVCEEGIFEVEATNNLLIPQSSKTILAQKLQVIPEKIRMYCTNCHKTNHNVETFRVKRNEDLVPAIFKITTQQMKIHRLVRYSCHICGDTGHKIIDCPKYYDNMFKNKGVKPTKK
jgi:ribosomal protein L44E